MNTTSINQLQLEREAPELYAAIVERSVMIERARVLVHLNVANYYNSLEESIEAVAAGTPVNEPYPYLKLHDTYCFIEDERNRLEEVAIAKYGIML